MIVSSSSADCAGEGADICGGLSGFAATEPVGRTSIEAARNTEKTIDIALLKTHLLGVWDKIRKCCWGNCGTNLLDSHLPSRVVLLYYTTVV